MGSNDNLRRHQNYSAVSHLWRSLQCWLQESLDSVRDRWTISWVIMDSGLHWWVCNRCRGCEEWGSRGLQLIPQQWTQQTADIPTGKHCSNYTADVDALILAANFIRSSEDQCPQVVFLTDALSVLEALDNGKLDGLQSTLHQVSRDRRAVLQWVPSHCIVTSHCAKQGAAGDQEDNTESRFKRWRHSAKLATELQSRHRTTICWPEGSR